MAKGTFVLSKAKDGRIYFNLLAANKQVICTSQPYTAKASALNGIDSIRRNADSEIEDQTLVKPEPKKCPKWEIFSDVGDKYRFRLKASNGETLLASQGYTTKDGAKKGIASIQSNAPDADIDDQTA